MASILKKHLEKRLELKNDPMRTDMSTGTSYPKYGFSVGKYTYGYQQFFYEGVNLKEIGAFCSIAQNVTITGMNHPTDHITTNPFIYYKSRGFINEDRADLIDEKKNGKVIIGNDVWIGTNVTILPSVTIGNGAIIGAGSVITKDIPDYAVVAGKPAKIIKYRFSEEEITLLNASQWWNWSDEAIKEHISEFSDKKEFFNTLKSISENKNHKL
ncbi:TPA: CatB-related O-acetyltransferase [Streptococcus agalactiae]